MTSSVVVGLNPCNSSLKHKLTGVQFGYWGVCTKLVTSGKKLSAAAAVCCRRADDGDVTELVMTRRSANYKDCVWDHDYIQSSMCNDYIEERYKIQNEAMNQQVVVMLGCISDQAEQLWWTNLGFKKDLSFARDSLVVSYLWGIMASPAPQCRYSRRAIAKAFVMVSTVDDVYDIYGTLEELELFTNAFEKWDIDSMKQLPHYMKKCYLACYNSVNDMAYDLLNDKGIDVTSSLKKAWGTLTSVYMKEARWFHSGYKPTLDEYMSNAWLSISIPLVSLHGHIFDTKPLEEMQVQYLETLPDMLKWACTIVRLCDDLGTSQGEMARGDNPIECYMNDNGASEQAAREHVEVLVREGWKKLNKYVMEERTLTAVGVQRLLNLVRAGHCFYQHGDGHGVQDGETRELMSQVLFDPIPLE